VVRSFLSYSSGIYLASYCNATSINHAMVIVGYDVMAGLNSLNSYWIIRNSWSKGWGESGYIRVQMTNDDVGACGMYR
jgi:C1A family cysteine protease